MAYITKTDVLNYLQIETNAFIDAGFANWLASVEAFIEKYTGTIFEKTSSEDRYFDGNGKSILYLTQEDDLMSIDASKLLILNSNGTTLAILTEGQSNDFLLYPLNTTPKFEIRLSPGSSIGSFIKGDRRVKITGVWGNADSVPNDIKLAATQLIAEIVKEGGVGGGDIKSTSLGDYSVTYTDVTSLAGSTLGVLSTLDLYRDFTPG